MRKAFSLVKRLIRRKVAIDMCRRSTRNRSQQRRKFPKERKRQIVPRPKLSTCPLTIETG
uniref:Uncharacterized protein n=1 Tax=Mesocestoides corti TaxID=53468 RepID=A0A5K3EL22_MESCO